MSKQFICIYDVRIGETKLTWHHLAQGNSKDEVMKAHEVEHDDCGFDTNDSPLGGGAGQYITELHDVKEITPKQKKFLNDIGIF